MKKHIIGLLAIIGIFASSSSFALAMLAEPVTDVDPSGTGTCLVLENNLKYRMRDASVGGDIYDLQDFLIAGQYLTGEPTGYFGSLTLRGVKKFQSANGITPTGYVGAYTRAKVKELSCEGVVSVFVDPKVIGRPEPIRPIACTMEARMCPDGSMMPRGPKCEWYPEKCKSDVPVTPTPYDVCRLESLNGVNITQNAIADYATCVSSLCDVWGPANLPKIESKCIFKGQEVKRYTNLVITVVQPSIIISAALDGKTFTVGDVIPIEWAYAGVPANTQAVVEVKLVSATSPQVGNLAGGTWQSGQYQSSGKDVYNKMTGPSYMDIPGMYEITAKLITCVPMGCNNSNQFSNPSIATSKTVRIKLAPKSTVPPVATGELHAVGVYEAGSDHSFCHSAPGKATVKVRNIGKPIVLALSAYEGVEWSVLLDSGATVERVILSGYNPQSVIGLPSGVPVSQYTFYSRDRVSPGVDTGSAVFSDSRRTDGMIYHWASMPSQCPESAAVPMENRVYLKADSNYFYAYKQGDADYQKLASKLKTLTGLDVTSFQGAYTGTAFTVPKDISASVTELKNLASVLSGMQSALDALRR